MKKGMCITYEVEDALYVNVTNRCSNNCSFCIRNNGDGAYGSDSLWLSREPDEGEIVNDILSRPLAKYKELVFCGYGEPTCRLDVIVSVARRVRAVSDIPIRLNTNGQSDLINGRSTARELCGAFDTVSISLNASCSSRYVEICRPVYKNKAFDAVISFAKDVKDYVPFVVFSVVGDSLTEREVEECRTIAHEVGIPLRVRDYIPPQE